MFQRGIVHKLYAIYVHTFVKTYVHMGKSCAEWWTDFLLFSSFDMVAHGSVVFVSERSAQESLVLLIFFKKQKVLGRTTSGSAFSFFFFFQRYKASRKKVVDCFWSIGFSFEGGDNKLDLVLTSDPTVRPNPNSSLDPQSVFAPQSGPWVSLDP